jgi:hypothetical protein
MYAAKKIRIYRYLPKAVPILSRFVKFDANRTVFSIVTVILLIALIAISGTDVKMADP